MSIELESRILTLERRIRLLFGVLLAAGVLALLGAASPSDPVVENLRSRSFELLDANGRVRARLALHDGTPVLALLDEAGAERLTLNHDAGGTALLMRDNSGVVRLGAAHFAHGGGGFALHGPDSKGAAVLYYDGSGSLTFHDPDGATTLRIPEDPE